PRPVGADDSHDLARLDLEGHVMECPDGVRARLVVRGRPTVLGDGRRRLEVPLEPAPRGLDRVSNGLAEAAVLAPFGNADVIELAHVDHADGRLHSGKLTPQS